VVDLTLPNVPDGPADLVVGAFTISISVFAETAQAVIPALAQASSSDVVADAHVQWMGSMGLEQTAPLLDAFTWDVPALISVTPGAVPFDAANSVLIELDENVVSYGIGSARFNGLPGVVGTWFEIAGTSYVMTIAPAQLAPGDYPIELEITSGGVTEFTRAESRGLVYLGPGINGMSAISGFQGGGESVTFDLVDFEPGTPITVDFGSAQTSGIPTGFLASSSMTVTTPVSSVPGVVDITLTQDLGGGLVKSVTSPSAWEFLPPTVSILSVVSGPQAGATPIVATTEGFSPGLIDITLGGVTFAASVVGIAPTQTISFSTPSATAPGPSDVRFVQGIFDVSVVAGFDFLPPSVSSVSPDKGAWYADPGNSLTITGANFAPNVLVEVSLGTDSALVGTVVDGGTITVDLPIGHVSGAGPLDVTVTQASIDATLTGGWTSLPGLAVGVTGDAAAGGTVDVFVDAANGGVAYMYFSATLLPGATPIGGFHHGLELDPFGAKSLGTVALLPTQPTASLPYPGGLLPPDSALAIQVFAFEAGAMGAKYSFTNGVSFVIP
ncbi:MAG: IPT/TIG domain-containing protein, partial [Planctomycetota bacterium]|nr:IPT/TIG domain-containing protein [Planctomycetota bacterium]